VTQQKAETSPVVVRSPPGDLASEHEGDDAPVHVLVDPGEGNRLDIQAGLLADFAAHAVEDGLAEFEDAAGWFPAVVVGALDEQGAAVVVGDDACHADRVPGLLGIQVDHP
jgi:hypothetical protein